MLVMGLGGVGLSVVQGGRLAAAATIIGKRIRHRQRQHRLRHRRQQPPVAHQQTLAGQGAVRR